LLVLAAPLHAQSRERARELANRAADAVARGEHHTADQLLEQAYREYPAPTIALLHARTLLQLRRLASALFAYQRAASSSVPASAPEAFRRAVADARREAPLLEPRVPRLLVMVRGAAANNPQLRIELDGERVPATQRGRWILVDPGRRIVRTELAGKSSEQAVQIEERQASVVEIDTPGNGAQRALTLTALGVGAVGLGVGIVTGVMANSAHAQARGQCEDNQCVAGSSGARNLERFRKLRVYSTVGYGISALGLGTGGYLLLRGSFSDSPLRVELERVALSSESMP
jgi:hypothetical protein